VPFVFLQARILWFLLQQFECFESDNAVWMFVLKSQQITSCYLDNERKQYHVFKVWKFVLHHHTIQINQPTRCNNFSSLVLEVYVQLNMFRASSSPSSGAQQLR
jgi:hypothetical protein